MAKAAAREHEAHVAQRWGRHYKKSLKTLLMKIKVLIWAQYISVREYMTRNLTEVLILHNLNITYKLAVEF